MILSRFIGWCNARLRAVPAVLIDAARRWSADRAPSMGAAIAYYMVFSLAPILILVIAVAGLAFGEAAARGAIVEQFGALMGREGAAALEVMIRGASRKSAGVLATLIGSTTLLLAATAVFGELQAALNVIWQVGPSQHARLSSLVRARLLSLSLIIAIGFLLLVSLVISAAIAGFGSYLDTVYPGLHALVLGVNLVSGFCITTVLFGLMFKILPDTHVAWRDVWHGAAVTAILFGCGKYLISLYIGSSRVASTYGAAGALVVILLWIYYSAQIVLFGAELARAWAAYDAQRRREHRAPSIAAGESDGGGRPA